MCVCVCVCVQICEAKPCGIQTRAVICSHPLGNCDMVSIPPVERLCSTCGLWNAGHWSMVSIASHLNDVDMVHTMCNNFNIGFPSPFIPVPSTLLPLSTVVSYLFPLSQSPLFAFPSTG